MEAGWDKVLRVLWGGEAREVLAGTLLIIRFSLYSSAHLWG